MELRVLIVASYCFLPLYATLSGLYVDNGVDQTVMHRALSRREKREMQQEILNMLGLHTRPRPSVRGVTYSAPKFLLDVYKSIQDNDGFSPNTFKARSEFDLTGSDIDAIGESDVIMSFVNSGHHVGNLRHERDKALWFDVTEVPVGENVVGAEVRMFKRKVQPKDSDTLTVTLHQLVDEDLREKKLVYADCVNTTYDYEGWLRFNVTSSLVSWVTFPSSNLGLYVSVGSSATANEIRPTEAGVVNLRAETEKQPFMVGFFKSPGHREIRVRSPRGTRRRKKSHSSQMTQPWHSYSDPFVYHSPQSCQRRNLYISFKDLNFQDWIIAPEGYSAYYCFGECSFPLNAHTNATNHAIIQTLVNLMQPSRAPQPRCAPTSLFPISVLYFVDDVNVTIKRFSNMVVRNCGCH